MLCLCTSFSCLPKKHAFVLEWSFVQSVSTRVSHAVLLIYDLLSVLFGRYAFANVFLWINESTEISVDACFICLIVR